MGRGPRRAAAFAAVMLIACGESASDPLDETPADAGPGPDVRDGATVDARPPCAFDVFPAAVDFGDLEVGELARRRVTVRHAKSEPCRAESGRVAITGDDGFDVRPEEFVAAPELGEEIVLTFELTASRATVTPTAVAEVSIDGTPVGEIELAGRSLFEPLLDTPDEIRLIDHGCWTEWRSGPAWNRQRRTVTVEAVTFEGPEAFGFVPPTLPMELGRSDGYGPTFEYDSGLEDHRGELTVRVSWGEFTEQYEIPVIGTYELREVREGQTGFASRDLMIIMDDLEPRHVDRLLVGLDALLDAFDLNGVDYQVGVLDTRDEPFGDYRRETSSVYLFTPDMRRTQPDWLEDRVREAPSGTQRRGIFDAMELGYGRIPTGSLRNSAFMRGRGEFWVFIVSERDDESPGTTQDYANRFLSVRGQNVPNDQAFAISGGEDGCDDVPPSPRLVDLVTTLSSPRQLHSICNADWTSFFENLVNGSGIKLKTRFEVPEHQPGTLRVFMDDVQIEPDDWTIGTDAWGDLYIEFDELPPRGTAIRFLYFPTCAP